MAEDSSYHDLHITTKDIERTSIFNLPYGFEVKCMRTTGWVLWDHGTRMSPHLREVSAKQLAGEYAGPDEWLILDVDGYVIVNSRDRVDDEDDEMVELKGDDILMHLRADAPSLRCSGCGRQTWSGNKGVACGMTQPDGSACPGAFR